MKKRFFLIGVLLVSLITNAFAQDFIFAKGVGGSGQDLGQSIASDNSGNSISVGWFNGTADFNPGNSIFNLISSGGNDCFILKLDHSGNFKWVKKIGGNGLDRAFSVSVDQNNDIYITGQFNGTVDFDPGNGVQNMTSSGSSDIFILKLDSSGNYLWSKKMGGSGTDVGMSVKIDDYGNIYSTGYFHSTADFDPGNSTFNLRSAFGSDVFISKLDSAGNFKWAKRIGGTGQDLSFHLYLDSNKSVFVCGSFNSTADFDPSSSTSNHTSSGDIDGYLVKLDSSGNFKWATTMGGNGSDKTAQIASSPYGQIYLTGYFSSTADFGSGSSKIQLTSNGDRDIFIAKLNKSGNYIWAKKVGGVGLDEGISITSDLIGNSYIAGKYSSSVDFDPGAKTSNNTSNGGDDLFILKLDSSGKYKWSIQSGGSSNDHINDLFLQAKDTIISVGKFQNTVDFDPSNNTSNLTSASTNKNDVFITKFAQCLPSDTTIIKSSCNSYTSPSGKFTWKKSGIFTDTLTNMQGCDSLLTINLTINTFSTDSISITACNSYTSPSRKFTWTLSGLFHDTITNHNGCDSILFIDLTINHSSFDSVTVTSCDQYLSPSGKFIWKKSGTFLDTIQNTAGCDSFLVIHLTIQKSSSNIIFANLCPGSRFVSPSGRFSWDSNGTFFDTIPNQSGCDSNITINLNFKVIDTLVIRSSNNATLRANADSATYQWLDCNANFNPIIGANQKSFTPNSNGRYAVKVSQNNCSDTSSCYEVILTSIQNIINSHELKLLVSPNPASGIVEIKTKEKTIIYLYNSQGQLVFQKQLKNKKELVDFSKLSSGIYFLNAVNNSFNNSIKLIIKP